MNDRQFIIESALRAWQPSDGDLIAYINGILVEENQPQLRCVERRDALDSIESLAGAQN